MNFVCKCCEKEPARYWHHWIDETTGKYHEVPVCNPCNQRLTTIFKENQETRNYSHTTTLTWKEQKDQVLEYLQQCQARWQSQHIKNRHYKMDKDPNPLGIPK